YERERTGLGQRVETDLLSAGMLLASDAFVGPDALPQRNRLDKEQTGFGPYHRLYETKEGWICVVAVAPQQQRALRAVLGVGSDEPAAFEAAFRRLGAADWFDALDAAGVPCEVARDCAESWPEDPDILAHGGVAAYDHPVWGRLKQVGALLQLSDT